MASTDTRSGFRLPWSSDRSHEELAAETASDTASKAASDTATDGPDPAAADASWPNADLSAALGPRRTVQRPVEAEPTTIADTKEPSPMLDLDTAPAPSVAPKKPSKLMVDLSAAIRATAQAAQTQTLEQVGAESQQVIDAIRASSTDGATALKQRSDEELASIREWSKAEIARIREETDTRITARKATLEDELAGHAAAVERRVDEVSSEVAGFEAAMAAYRERLVHEDDPARLATMAEQVPETPTFDAWSDLSTLDITSTEAVGAVPAEEAEPVSDIVDEAEGNPSTSWGDETNAWAGTPADEAGEIAAPGDDVGDDVPRWSADAVPDGFPADDGAEAGDPVDRGAIMAALEAAAEAVVAAESAAESADQAEAAADVAETAAERLIGRTSNDDEYDPAAAAAMNARVDAGGFETESFQDRLASLMPVHGDGIVGDDERTTQVVVVGLVSVASIASFKRHLGRLPGVQAVAVASGPEGEFVFNIMHRAELSLRDAIPTMPGFAARVSGTGDGVVHVTARDPEIDG